jgi:hypothetical protein
MTELKEHDHPEHCWTWTRTEVEFINARVRDYGRAEYLRGLEQAAKVCDDYAVDKWNLYKGRPPYTGKEDGRADPHIQGESCGADDCVEAIRALMEST